MSSTPVENALFEPILQCVSKYTADRLVLNFVIFSLWATRLINVNQNLMRPLKIKMAR